MIRIIYLPVFLLSTIPSSKFFQSNLSFGFFLLVVLGLDAPSLPFFAWVGFFGLAGFALGVFVAAEAEEGGGVVVEDSSAAICRVQYRRTMRRTSEQNEKTVRVASWAILGHTNKSKRASTVVCVKNLIHCVCCLFLGSAQFCRAFCYFFSTFLFVSFVEIRYNVLCYVWKNAVCLSSHRQQKHRESISFALLFPFNGKQFFVCAWLTIGCTRWWMVRFR